MLKWPLIGNEHIVDFLSKSIKNNNLAHFYIFEGPKDIGKNTLAQFFSKIILCQNKDNELEICDKCSSCKMFNKNNSDFFHNDLHILSCEKEKKNISIKQTREFIKKLNFSSFSGGFKIGIIKSANDLNIKSANALLKTLEEPKENVIIILITNDLYNLPKTILSRSQILKFKPIPIKNIYNYLIERGLNRSRAKILSRICLGRPALAVKFSENKEFYEEYLEKVKIFFDCLLSNDLNYCLSRIEVFRNFLANEIMNIINIWEGAGRDLFLYILKQDKFLQNIQSKEEIEKLSKRIDIKKIRNIFQEIDIAKQYLLSNVKPYLVLENLLINI